MRNNEELDVYVELNKKYKKAFYENKTEENLEKYVMSELIPPIADYYNAKDLIGEYKDIITKMDLFYIASYYESSWDIGKHEWIDFLESKLNNVDDNGKAIIYYLKANHCMYNDFENEYDIKKLLLKSIEYSKNMYFSNNRVDMAKLLNNSLSKKYMKEALDNIILIADEEYLKNVNDLFWYNANEKVKELILGISISDVIYETRLEMYEKYLKI